MATSMHAPPQEVDPAAALRPPASRRRHWPRRLGVAFLTLVLGTFLSNWWWGRRASARLEAQLATARAAGEPVTVEQLTRWPALRTGTGPNVVPALRAAAELIDSSSDAWGSFEGADKTLPLTDQEAAALAAGVRHYPHVPRPPDRIPADGGVDWEAEYTSPLIKYQYPPTDLNGMRALAQLLQADALLAHGAGDDRRALLRCGQILRLGRAVSYQPQLVPHLVALGITGIGTSAVGEIVPELRVAVAGNEGVPPEQVRALIAELSNERALRDGWRRAMVGERVMVVDVAQSMIEGRLGFDDFRPNGQPPKSGPNVALPGTAVSAPQRRRPGRLRHGRAARVAGRRGRAVGTRRDPAGIAGRNQDLQTLPTGGDPGAVTRASHRGAFPRHRGTAPGGRGAGDEAVRGGPRRPCPTGTERSRARVPPVGAARPACHRRRAAPLRRPAARPAAPPHLQ